MRPEEYDIYKNKAQCTKCGDVIESRTVHEFVGCKCGSIFLDGGRDYWRCGGDFRCIKRIYEKFSKK